MTSPTPAAGPMRPGRAPSGPGPAPVVAVLLAFSLLALSVVLVREALVVLGAVEGQSWLQPVAAALPVLVPTVTVIVVGAVLVLLGLWLVYLALRPRTRTSVQVEASTGVFTMPGDLARLASYTAREVDGVLGARTTATRRAVTVRIATTGDPDVTEAVQAAVTERLSLLRRPVKVRVPAASRGGEDYR